MLQRLALLSVLLAHPAMGQEARYSLALRDVPLEEAVEALVAQTGISLVYGAEVDGARVFCRAVEALPEDLLRCIVESAGVDYYRMSSGTYVVIEKAEEAPRYGDLAGVVLDGETGEPLPGASVLLADALVGMASNEAGLFAFSRLAPGPYVVVASFLGYEPVADSVWVPPDGRARRALALRPKRLRAAPLVVDGLQRRAVGLLPGQAEVEAEQLRSAAPGAPAGSALLLGVGSRPLAADLHIQGGETGEHVTRLDGALVYDPVALGRLVGAFSPLAVERLTVRKAGFGASHGSYTAGLVEVAQALPPRATATVQADPYSLNAQAALGGARAVVAVTGRTSLWSLARPPALDAALRRWNRADPVLTAALTGEPVAHLGFEPHAHGSDVGFSDLHAAARLRLGPFRTLRASAYRGSSEVATELLEAGVGDGGRDEVIVLSRDRYAWTNLTGRVRVEALLGARVLAQAGLRGSRHTLGHAYQTVRGAEVGYAGQGGVDGFEGDLRALLDGQPLPDDGSRVAEWALDGRFDLSLAPGHVLETGLEAVRTSHAFHLGSPYFRRLRSGGTQSRLAVFANDQVALAPSVTLEAGVRLTWVPGRAAAYAEPRLAVRYDAARSPVGPASLRLAGGLYRQFVNQFDLTNVGPSAVVPSVRFWLPVDASLAPPRALHAALEGMATPAAGWTLRAEAYYKHLPHLLALDYPALFEDPSADEAVEQNAFVGAARGFAWGGGVRVQREAGRLRLDLGYDRSVSRRTVPSRFGGALQPTPWNQPHRALLSADLDAGRGVSARLRARGVWGRRWAFRQAYYDFLPAHAAAPFVGQPEDDVLPPLYELDLGVGVERTVGGARVALRLDLLNVIGRANVLDYSLRRAADRDRYEAVARRGIGLQPLLTLRVGL